MLGRHPTILHYLDHHDPTDNDVRQIARLWDEDPLPRGAAILEVGAHDEPLADALATMDQGYRVTGIDLRPYPGTIPTYEHRVADVLTAWLPRAWYDAVVAVSTIEHVGLAEFGGIQDPAGDLGDAADPRGAAARGPRVSHRADRRDR